MRELRDKLILTDCDGVLLDWEYHFYKWLKETEGYERLGPEYNIAKAIGVGWLTNTLHAWIVGPRPKTKIHRKWDTPIVIP